MNIILLVGIAFILSGGAMLDRTNLFITGIMSAIIGFVLFCMGIWMVVG